MIEALLLAAALADPAAEYAQRAAKVPDKDAKGWLALADFCEEGLLWESRAEALRKAAAADPENPQAHARLDEKRWDGKWIPAGEAEAAEIGANRARGLAYQGAKWVQPKDAEKSRDADRKAVGWACDFRMDTRRLSIYSSQPLEETWRLAALLESELDAYLRLYGPVWKLEAKPRPFRIYVFGDRGTFEKVMKADTGSAPQPWQVGYYYAGNQVLYVGRSDEATSGNSERVTAKLAVHEMLHALDHQWAHLDLGHAAIPMWLVEGRADHFGNAVSGRQVLPGSLHLPPQDAEPNDLGKILPALSPGALMDLSREAFAAESQVEHYALSWALVHYLLHAENGRRGPAFRAFLKGMPARASRAEFEKAVGKLSEIEPAFKAWAEGTLVPASLASREEGR